MLTIIFNGFTQPPLSTSPPLAFLPIQCGPGNKAEIFQWRKEQKGRRSRDHLWQVIREKKMRTVEGGRGKWGVKGKVWDSSWKQFSNSKQKLNKAGTHVSILLSNKDHALFYGSQSKFYILIYLSFLMTRLEDQKFCVFIVLILQVGVLRHAWQMKSPTGSQALLPPLLYDVHFSLPVKYSWHRQLQPNIWENRNIDYLYAVFPPRTSLSRGSKIIGAN